jgi:hypothetical protein
LGSRTTLPHYANTKLLDGDPHKITVADTTPDFGFDLRTASTYPANQGRPRVLRTYQPDRMARKRLFQMSLLNMG